MKRRCPECGAKHDTRPCRRVGATSCDCCRAIFGTRHPAPERVPPIDNHAYGLWQPEATPPDRSWVTTEDISDWPSARRPKEWSPAGGFAQVLVVIVLVAAIVAMVTARLAGAL